MVVSIKNKRTWLTREERQVMARIHDLRCNVYLYKKKLETMEKAILHEEEIVRKLMKARGKDFDKHKEFEISRIEKIKMSRAKSTIHNTYKQ